MLISAKIPFLGAVPVIAGTALSWRLELGCRPDPAESVVPADMTGSYVLEQSPDRLVCEWKGHPVYGKTFTVRTEWQREAGAPEAWSGRISYRGNSGRARVEAIHFPVAMFGVTPETRFLVPYSLGMLTPPVSALPEWMSRYELNGGRAAAVLGPDGQSLYFADLDPKARPAEVSVGADPKDRSKGRLFFTYYVPLTDATRRAHRRPYLSEFRSYRGGWFEAAEFYRVWARKQFWYRNALRLKKRRERVREIGLWAWNRGAADTAIPPLLRFQRDSGVPCALDWYWWHHNPYDTDYPDFWPPREGVSAFRRSVSELNRAGVYSQVYTNGALWDMDGVAWADGGTDSALVNRDGSIKNHAFNRFNGHRLAYMCGEAPSFQKKMRKLAAQLCRSGLTGMYLDVIGNTGGVCWNPAHRHALNGGTYYVDGYRAFAAAIRADNPGFLLSTEDCAEAYLDLFDSMIVLTLSGERLWLPDGSDMVPFFPAVYHGTAALFGNYDLPDGIPPWDPLWPDSERWQGEKEWEKIFPDQFFVEFARGIAFGMQPSVHNLKTEHAESPRFRDIYSFMVRGAQFYHAHREYLYDGEMLSPGTLRVKSFNVEFFRRMIFTKNGEYNSRWHTLPTVLHSRWRAPDGRTALVLVNTSSETQQYSYDSGDGSAWLTGTLPPHSFRLIETA